MQNSLRKVRKERGLSQKALAEAMGYDFRTVSQYEKSADPLPDRFLQKAAEVLRIAPSSIESPPKPMALEDETPPYIVQPGNFVLELQSDERLTEMARMALEELAVADPDRKQKIFRLIKEVGAELERRGLD